MQHKKLKIMAIDRAQWDAIVAHARTLGAISRDNQYGYNAEKPAMVIDNNYIKYSSPTMKPKPGIAPAMKISVNEFLALTSLHDAGHIGTPCAGKVAAAVASVKEATPTLGKNMKVTDCKVLTQNATIFMTKGIPALQKLGVEITMDNDKPYILDVENNDAVELTTDYVATQAKADLLDGKDTAFTRYANSFQLFTEVVTSKVIEAS